MIYEESFRDASLDVRYLALYPMWAMGRGGSTTPLSSGLASRVRATAAGTLRSSFDVVSGRRLIDAARHADVVFLVKTDSPDLVRRLRHSSKARLVYDLADTRPHKPHQVAVLHEIISYVDAITVDNDFALRYASRFGKPVHLFPPVAYVERFDELRATSRRGRDGQVTLGWIGTPSTASNLYLILDALEDVAREHPNITLRLLGVPAQHDIIGRFERVRATSAAAYDAKRMVREVLDMDIGLFPQYDLEQAAMHGVTKALIYMAGGAVVLATPLGETAKLVRDGENGFLATDRAAWSSRLSSLVRDEGLRMRISAAALGPVREVYSVARCFESLRHALGV